LGLAAFELKSTWRLSIAGILKTFAEFYMCSITNPATHEITISPAFVFRSRHLEQYVCAYPYWRGRGAAPSEAAKRCIASPSPDLDHIADESLGHAKLLQAQCAPIVTTHPSAAV
jgi:hypothetical protein